MFEFARAVMKLGVTPFDHDVVMVKSGCRGDSLRLSISTLLRRVRFVRFAGATVAEGDHVRRESCT
jgi:hypothetical protein